MKLIVLYDMYYSGNITNVYMSSIVYLFTIKKCMNFSEWYVLFKSPEK